MYEYYDHLYPCICMILYIVSSMNPTCQMGLGLFAGSLSDGTYNGDQVLLLLVLMVVLLQQSLAHLHSHAVVQLFGRFLVVQHHVCGKNKNGRVRVIEFFF